MDSVFSGLSLIIVVGAVIALIMRLIGQPLIIGHILTGIIVGPAVLHLAKSPDTLALFSDLGIALLLFIIGLGLNPKIVREVSGTAAVVGVIQVAVISALGWTVGGALGLPRTGAAIFGAALALSSTIIILKVLSDKHEQARLYGKIAISISLVQDLIAIVLVVLTSAGSDKNLAVGSALSLAVKGGFLALAIFWVSNRLLPNLNKLISGSQEFLFLFAIAWGLGSATLFAKIGLSTEIGALLAGICLATQPYAQEISSRLRPLRDFFLIVFFIALGANLGLGSLGSMVWVLLAGAVIAIIIKPLVALAILGFLGFTKRTSFKASVALAQVSEFSIVLVLLAEKRGLITSDLVTAVTFTALCSIAASTYLILFSDHLYGRLERYLDIFERSQTRGESRLPVACELVLFGYQKGGHEFVHVFRQMSKKYVVIDYDPEVIEVLENRKVPHIFGDATDIELLEEAGVAKARLIVSTVTDFEVNSFLLSFLDRKNSGAVFIAQADNPRQAAALYDLGASYVILPHFIGGEKIGAFVRQSNLSKSSFKKFRDAHIRQLKRQHHLDRREAEHKKLGHAIVAQMTALAKAKS
ncbi:MAG TPA: cation:proton antiporter [Candidatus Saccharimonadales bacterium]|nr:cation:proton antiporter [Candidatus Saccharimonadales bacterium]